VNRLGVYKKRLKRVNMKKESLIKIGVSSITVIVLFILVFSSPAQAFLIGLTTTDSIVSKGNIINFIASLKIDSDEFVNVDYVNLKINNSNSTADCKFLLNGTIVNGCSGITITPFTSSAEYGYGYGYIYGYETGYGYDNSNYSYVDDSNYGYEAGYGYNPSYGYGYGWNNGILKYNITLDTTNYAVGTYQTFLEVKTSDKITVQNGTTITITPFSPSSKECSLRATSGTVIVEDKVFSTNSLNFHVSTKNAQRGGGSISSQTGRDRFTYSFKIKEDLLEDKDKLVVLVSGKYRVGRANDSIETAILTLDKKTKKVSIIGPKINAQNLDVSFMMGCGSPKTISTHENE